LSSVEESLPLASEQTRWPNAAREWPLELVHALTPSRQCGCPLSLSSLPCEFLSGLYSVCCMARHTFVQADHTTNPVGHLASKRVLAPAPTNLSESLQTLQTLQTLQMGDTKQKEGRVGRALLLLWSFCCRFLVEALDS